MGSNPLWNRISISISQQGFINDRYKVNPVGQWGIILVMTMGLVDHLGLVLLFLMLTRCIHNSKNTINWIISVIAIFAGGSVVMFWKHDKIGENYWMTSRPSRQVMHCNDINVQFYDKIIQPKYYKNSNRSCTFAVFGQIGQRHY